jgi:hypothetical protein
MTKRGNTNPFVHPDPSRGMLNRAGNDGWSFDEYDKDDDTPVEVVTPDDRAKRVTEELGVSDGEAAEDGLEL